MESIEHDGLGQSVQLYRLVWGLELPEVFEILQSFGRKTRVGSLPGRALGVKAAGLPVSAATAPLRERRTSPERTGTQQGNAADRAE
jgi:hypothetical protein